MNKPSIYLFISLVSIISGCATLPDTVKQNSAVNYDNYVGWLERDCLLIRNSNVPIGSDVTLVQANLPASFTDVSDAYFPRISTAKIVRKAKADDFCLSFLYHGQRKEFNEDEHYFIYSVESQIINLQDPQHLYIALLGTPNTNAKIIDRSTFGYCLMSDGIEFRLTPNNLRDNHALWRGYYYLGYDTGGSDC